MKHALLVVVWLVGVLWARVEAQQVITFATTASGLQASYAMSNTLDASGNARTAVFLNTATVPGKYAEGQRFNGQAKMTIPTFQLTTSFTLEAWVNLGQLTRDVVGSTDAASVGWQAIIYKGHDNVFLAEHGKFFTAGFTTGNTLVQVVSPNQTNISVWHHIAATYDGAAIMLAIDGVQVARQAASGTIALSSQAFEVGGSSDGGALNGVIDEVRIYNRALSLTEIASDMATPVDTVREGVVGWDMEVWGKGGQTTGQVVAQSTFLKSAALCNLAPLPSPITTIVNPTKARVTDPELPMRECEIIIQTFIEALPVGLGYTSTLRAHGDTTQSDRSGSSNTFDRVAQAVAPLPPGTPAVR